MQSALIFDIQRFSLHDGPGIRTTVFFKGCPLHCAWCQNPESWQATPEIAFYAHLCRRCFDCSAACEETAIRPDPRHRVDYTRCTACGQCSKACISNALRAVGRTWFVDDLVSELIKDADYFMDSGGGITLSGGEPLLQSGFLQALLPKLKELQLHVTMETCGVFAWQQMETLLPYLDLIFFDLKLMDDSAHAKYTGLGNALILDNFSRLSNARVCLQARMPVIPGINDSRENIAAVAKFLKLNAHKAIHCLPYHHLGEAKIPRLNTPQKKLNLISCPDADGRRAKTLFAAAGIEAQIYE